MPYVEHIELSCYTNKHFLTCSTKNSEAWTLKTHPVVTKNLRNRQIRAKILTVTTTSIDHLNYQEYHSVELNQT